MLAAVSGPLGVIQGGHERVASALRTCRAALRDIGLRVDLSDLGKKQGTEKATDTALRALDAIAVDALAAAQKMEAKLEAYEGDAPASADPMAALLFESQLTRAWARTRAVLDGSPGGSLPEAITALIAAAAKSNDKATLAAFEEEIAAYVQARQTDNNSGVYISVDDVLATIRQQRMPYMSAEGRAAAVIEAQASTAYGRLQAAIQMARNELAGGSAVFGLPGAGRDDKIDV